MADVGGSKGRTHLVLVPGFGGFDALGEVEYYSGVTKVFKEWRARQHDAEAQHAVIHYFDNFPTAGVKTRASFLYEFLGKRIERNHIQPGDAVVLIGHSTGGLDIRQLIIDLRRALESRQVRPESRAIDGGKETAVGIDPADMRQLIQRVVFLSVPQSGTNIANWVQRYGGAPGKFLTGLRTVADAADGLLPERIDIDWLSDVMKRLRGDDKLDGPAHPSDSRPGAAAEEPVGVLAALADTQLEMAERDSDDPYRAAKGREAFANVNLWLSHSDGDFMAIDDLAATGEGAVLTRSNDQTLEEELEEWTPSSGRNPIQARSYLTLGRCPFRADWLEEYRSSRDSPFGSVAGLYRLFDGARRGPRLLKSDFFYRFLYLTCVRGPFRVDGPILAARFSTREDARYAPEQTTLEPWQNDGIVNTASMHWRVGDNVLVNADHGDVIGHYAFHEVTGFVRDDAAPDTASSKERRKGRRYASYDIFESASASGPAGQEREFDDTDFEALWSQVFRFAVSGA
jgi:hypothetical protein